VHWRYATRLREMRDRLASMPRRLSILSLAVMAGITLAAAGLVDLDWVQVQRAQEQSAWNLALAISDDFNRSIGNVNFKLDSMVSAIALDGADPRLPERLKREVRATSDQFGALLIVDDQGQVRVSTSDQFKPGSIESGFEAAIARRGLTFSTPLIVDGERWLPMVRPIGQESGHPISIVAMLRLSYFERRVAALRSDPKTMIGVFEPNGPGVFRLPELALNIDRTVPDHVAIHAVGTGASVSFMGRSPVDRVDRLTVVMRAGSLPIGVMVGIPISEFVQIWWPQAATLIFLAASMLLLMVMLHFTLATELYCRHQAEALIAEAVDEANRVGAQFRLLAEFSSDVLCEIKFDSGFGYTSPAMERLLGWSRDELVGIDPRTLTHPDDLLRMRELSEGLTPNSGPQIARFRHLCKNGSYIWVEASIQLTCRNGAPEGFVSVMRDITDRVEVERRLAEASSELEQLAATDQLTGVANRRRFDQELAREWRRTTREELPLSLLLLDVDFFKIYNDTYGHQGGDQVLKAVASAIGGTLQRPADLVARWGGEEFAVLLPATDIYGAIEVAEIIRVAVEILHIPHRDTPGGCLTVSIGVASTYPSSNNAAEPLIAEADTNLYEAKRLGRNRVSAQTTTLVSGLGRNTNDSEFDVGAF